MPVIFILSVSAELEEKVKHCKQVEESGNKKAKDLESKVKNAKAIQEQALKNAEKDMNALKKKAEDSRTHWKQREQVICTSHCIKSG